MEAMLGTSEKFAALPAREAPHPLSRPHPKDSCVTSIFVSAARKKDRAQNARPEPVEKLAINSAGNSFWLRFGNWTP